MKLTYERELILKALEDNLSAEESRRLQSLFEASPKLKEEYNDLLNTQQMIAWAKYDSFKPYFADRVLKRLRGETDSIFSDDFYISLVHNFYRLAFTVLLLVMLLGSYNIFSADNTSNDQPVIESVIALPPMSVINTNTTILNYKVFNNENTN